MEKDNQKKKKETIENFLQSLGSADGEFFIVCGKCGASDALDENGGAVIEQDIEGVYSDYTGHLWDTVDIKCIKCGNAKAFDK